MKNQKLCLIRNILSSSTTTTTTCNFTQEHGINKFRNNIPKKLTKSTSKIQLKNTSQISHQHLSPVQPPKQELIDNQLDHLIHNALQYRHLDPIQFNQLASVCSRQPTQLINLILGSLILNDHTRSQQYMNQLDPAHYEDLYPRFFKLCGLIGRGMGMMRRVIKAIQSHQDLVIHHHELSIEQNWRTRLKMIETIEAYIENLIRWSQIHRAWTYLNSFDFGPCVDLQEQVDRIGGTFAQKIRQIKKPSNSFKIWKPNQSAYSSLISIYLILDRPDLALELNSQVNLTHIDQPMALILCARALISQKQKDQVFPSFTNLDQTCMPAIPGPITASTLTKLIYQQNGPSGLITFLSKLNHTNSASNRLLLSAWLDILIAGSREAPLEPVELGSWIELIHQEGLLGEPELEKYLRYTREWLEIELNQKIQFISSSRDQSILPSVSIEPSDPRLGYHQLFKFFQIVYDHQSSSSIQSTPHDDDPNLHHQYKPSTTVTSELIRISSLTGTSSKNITELIEKEVMENQTPIRSSHMIGLIWSKIVDQDLVGLGYLVEREIKFKYKLVLTGLLTTIILAGLIAIRAPKPIIIKMSQKLIEQCPTNSNNTSSSSSSLRKNFQTYRLDDQQHPTLESYLNLIKVAQSIGDLMMIKDVHELIVQNLGREKLVLAEVGLDYFRLIFDVYNHFNQPFEAHKEVIESLRHSDFFDQDKTGQIKEHSFHGLVTPDSSPEDKLHHSLNYENRKKFLSSGVLTNYLDFQSITKLFHREDDMQEKKTRKELKEAKDEIQEPHESSNQKMKKEGVEFFVKSLIKSKRQVEKKIEELNKLKKVFEESEEKDRMRSNESEGSGRRMNEKMDQEWQAKKKEEVEDRLMKLIEASHLNQLLLRSFNLDHPHPPPSSSSPDPSDLLLTNNEAKELKSNLNWRDRSSSDDLKIALKLIKKLF